MAPDGSGRPVDDGEVGSDMGMGKRLSLIVKSKANKLLDKHEDPRETLDYSYEKQLELLTQVRRGVADVATSRKRLEIQMQQLQASADKLQTQAQQAVAAGRDDLAREALTRRPRPTPSSPTCRPSTTTCRRRRRS